MTTGIVWFRRDLRLADHPAWVAATQAHDRVIPVFIEDPAFANSGPHRRRAIHGAVERLGERLEQVGASLHIAPGDPVGTIAAVVGGYAASTVWVTREYSPHAQRRDEAVAAKLEVPFRREPGLYIARPGAIHTAAGHVPRVFTAFWKRWQTQIPDMVRAASDRLDRDPADPMALAIEDFLDQRLARYSQDRDRPSVDGTSGLSVALKTGEVGALEILRHALEHTTHTGEDVDPFVRQLAWRDWYGHLIAESPHLTTRAQTPAYDAIEWRNDPDDIAAWQDGQTGYPIVDAGMRELRATGRMHNRVRMIAASFCVKDLLVDWRIGERWFRHWLADADATQNVGNWQWVAGTGPDAAPYFRVFNPTVQSRRFDPEGGYLRRWIPELARLSDAAIHEPASVAPLDLAAVGVTLGVDYPYPIVDHRAASAGTVEAYRRARQAATAPET